MGEKRTQSNSLTWEIPLLLQIPRLMINYNNEYGIANHHIAYLKLMNVVCQNVSQ